MLRSTSTFSAAVLTVQGSCYSTAQRPQPRRLRDGSPLHVNVRGDIVSSAWGLPSVLQDSVYYTPAHVEDADLNIQQYIHIATHTSVRVYILWPALQDAPSWLRNRFQLVKGTQLKVSWSFGFRQRAILNLSNKRQAFENQTLQVWQLLKVLPQGAGMSLPGPGLPLHATSLPMYGYLLAFKPATMDLSASAASLAAKLLASKDTNPLTCSLQQLQSSLEDGSISLEHLPPNAANGLLYRVMAEGEPELLLLLMEKGLGQQATPPALQDLLQYACNQRQLQLMELTLAVGTPELSKPMLDWWVCELTSTGSGYDAERLLADYCLSRRNPLSTVAAIELALWKVHTGSMDEGSSPSSIGLLTLKFGAVKHALLQMLLDRDAQQQAAAALLGHQDDGVSPTAGALFQQYYSPTARNNLQQVIIHCLESNDSAAVSIHDTSPFHGALRMNDTHLVNLPEVTAFTQQLWLGLELQQLWGVAGSRRLGARRASTSKKLISSSPTAVRAWKQAGRTATLAAKFKAAAASEEGAQGEGEPPSLKGAEAVAAVTAAARAGFAQDAGPPLHEPSVGYELLQNLGLAPRGREDGIGLLSSHMAHIVLLAPRAFYDSPRGQYLMHCITEALFLISYQMMVTKVSNRGLDVVLLLLVVGNLVQVLMQWGMRYRGSLKAYLSSHWAKLDVVVHLGMLVVAGEILLGDLGLLEHSTWIDDVAAALAIPVWARALGVIVPANARLGALLYTLGRMVEEASSMGLIIGVLLLGFSTTLYAEYYTRMDTYSTFVGSVRMVFGVMAGDLHLQDFEEASGGDSFYATFGQVVTMLFIVLVNILLISLLIAVINHIYSPEKVAKQTTVMFANAASSYAWQAEHGYALPPFNTLQLLLWWVPKRWRARVPHQACLRLWLPPVDGYSCRSGPRRCNALVPTGPAELSYLMLLLTLYPLTALMAAALLFLRLPAGVVHFVSCGYKQWVGGDARGRGKNGRPHPSRDSRGSLEIIPPKGPSIDWGAARVLGVVTAAQAARMRALVSMNRRAQQVAPEDLNWSQRAMGKAGRDTCAALSGVNKGVTWVTALVTAVVLQLVLVALLLVALAYSLAAQIVWTMWCVLFAWALPSHMVTDEPPTLKRSADFWSAGDLQLTFKQHKVLHRHSISRCSNSDINFANGQGSHLEAGVPPGAKSSKGSQPGAAEVQQTQQVQGSPAGAGAMMVAPMPGAVSRQASFAGAAAVPVGPATGTMSLHRVSGGPTPVPVYAECPGLVEPGRGPAARRPSILATAASGGMLMSPEASNSGSASGSNRSSNAPPAAWLVNHLSSILYSTDSPAPAPPAQDVISSANSNLSRSSSSSNGFNNSQRSLGPVAALGPSPDAATTYGGRGSSTGAAQTMSGTAGALDIPALGATSSGQPVQQPMGWDLPGTPAAGLAEPLSVRQVSSPAARSMATLR